MSIINKGYLPIDAAAMRERSTRAAELYEEARETTRWANEEYLRSRDSADGGEESAAAFKAHKNLKARAAELFREADALSSGRIFVARRARARGFRRGYSDEDMPSAPERKIRGAYRLRPKGSAPRTPEEHRKYTRERVAAWRARRRIDPLDGLV